MVGVVLDTERGTPVAVWRFAAAAARVTAWRRARMATASSTSVIALADSSSGRRASATRIPPCRSQTSGKPRRSTCASLRTPVRTSNAGSRASSARWATAEKRRRRFGSRAPRGFSLDRAAEAVRTRIAPISPRASMARHGPRTVVRLGSVPLRRPVSAYGSRSGTRGWVGIIFRYPRDRSRCAAPRERARAAARAPNRLAVAGHRHGQVYSSARRHLPSWAAIAELPRPRSPRAESGRSPARRRAASSRYPVVGCVARCAAASSR